MLWWRRTPGRPARLSRRQQQRQINTVSVKASCYAVVPKGRVWITARRCCRFPLYAPSLLRHTKVIAVSLWSFSVLSGHVGVLGCCIDCQFCRPSQRMINQRRGTRVWNYVQGAAATTVAQLAAENISKVEYEREKRRTSKPLECNRNIMH